jgi:outer membrane protein OmpA-like peptidoglycan-associated protein
MTATDLEWELENAAEAMAGRPRGQAGRFPARRFKSHLQQQGFIVTTHFLNRLLERAQAQGVRLDPRVFGGEFSRAQHFRQTRPGYNTRIAVMQGLPIVYRMGGPRGLNPVLVTLYPQDRALPPKEPASPPIWREAEFEEELETAAEGIASGVNRSSRGYIRWVQQSLNQILGTQLALDGISGPQTRGAIRDFQQRRGLVIDGIVGPQTEAALVRAGAPPPPSSGGSVVPTVSPCPSVSVDCPSPNARATEILDRFAFDEAMLVRPRHTSQVINVARQVLASQRTSSPVRSILIAGHTDHVGSDDYNFDLAGRRAHAVLRELCTTLSRMSPGITRQIRFDITSCGERQPKASDELSRRVEIFLPQRIKPPPSPPPSPPPTVYSIKLTAKSFIAPIGSRTGTATCFLPLPSPPPLPPTGADQRLQLLAAATDAAFSENPLTDVPDKRYRLFSECAFTVVCNPGAAPTVMVSPLSTDVGLECIPRVGACLLPPPMTVITPVTVRSGGPNTFKFGWAAKGRPHLAAEPTFQSVCPRTSVFIWHRIDGTITCGPSGLRLTSFSLNGSRFPSHRLFVNGGIVTTVPQTDFRNLWVPDPSDSSLVSG